MKTRNTASHTLCNLPPQASPAGGHAYCANLFDSIPAAILSTDHELRITGWNKAAEKIYGWSASETIGRKVTDVLRPEYPSMCHEDAIKRLTGDEPVCLEAAHRTKDGNLIMMLSEISPLRDPDGTLAGTVCVLRDISGALGLKPQSRHSKKTTAFLYEIVERLLKQDLSPRFLQDTCEMVMRFLGGSIFFNYLANDGRTLRLNACSGITESQKEELAVLEFGQGICGAVALHRDVTVITGIQESKEDRVSLLKPLGVRAYACHPLVAKDKLIGTLSFGTSRKDSFEAWELALMKVVCDHVAVAIHRLNTEDHLERMAQELSDKNRLITDFFTNISHEFKTPLSIILVNLQLMEYRMKNQDAAGNGLGKAVGVMRQNAFRLLRLIGNLLDVTKIDAGFMKARLVSTDIVELVRSLAESVGDIAGSAGLEVRFECDCQSRTVPLDCEKMERIILNLLSNAIKHTPSGGSIEVRMQCGQDHVRISVHDNGEGIPYDRQDIIFDRFRQANTSLTRSSEGCGIGLSLTKSLVELMKGRIWFTSSPGAGSEFFVELPVQVECCLQRLPEVEGLPLAKKLEMEFSDIHKIGSR